MNGYVEAGYVVVLVTLSTYGVWLAFTRSKVTHSLTRSKIYRETDTKPKEQ